MAVQSHDIQDLPAGWVSASQKGGVHEELAGAGFDGPGLEGGCRTPVTVHALECRFVVPA